jgi:hypothetical protein
MALHMMKMKMRKMPGEVMIMPGPKSQKQKRK